MPPRRRRFGRALLWGAPVELSPLPTDAEGGPWNVLAYETELRGYRKPDGTPSTLTKAMFDEMVANFGAYPKAPIVVEHADTRKEVALVHPEWAEPRGHVIALRVGTMTRTPPGASAPVAVATLEGRLAADPKTRLEINGDKETGTPPKWPFGSITHGLGMNEETDEPIGNILWSFSLTSHPRLADVPRLAAGRDGLREHGYWYGDIEDRDDVIAMLRAILELPVMSTEAEILAQLDKLGALITQPETEAGVDVDDIVASIRQALGLPVLTTAAAVIAEVRKALTTLPASESTSTSLSRGAPPKETRPMKFLEQLATFGLPAVATEEEAEKVFLALARDGVEARRTLNIPVGEALAPRIAAVVTDSVELARVKPELATARKERDDRIDAERVRHVDAVCLARGWGDDAKPALLAFAASDFKAFGEKYPMPSAEELSQRTQDADRTRRAVPPPVAQPGTEPGKPKDLSARIAELQSIYARAGVELTVAKAADAIQRGETAESARTAFGF